MEVIIDFDTKRDTSHFRYENPGLKELTFRGDYSTFAKSSLSRTGYEFCQRENYNQFPIPKSKELWVKFDWRFSTIHAKYNSYEDIRCYAKNNNKVSGLRFNFDWFNIFANEEKVHGIENPPLDTILHETILHYKVGENDGILEVWLDGELQYSGSNINVNDGADIYHFYIQGGINTWFSNIIISNRPLSSDDNCKKLKSYWVQPKTSNAGNMGLSRFAFSAKNSSGSNASNIFNGNIYSMGVGSEIIFFVKNPMYVRQVYLGSTSTLPFKGIVQWSDYGDEWQACGEWISDSDSQRAVANCYMSEPHRYFRIATTQNNPDTGTRKNYQFSSVNIFAELKEPMQDIVYNYDTARDAKYHYTLNGANSYGYNTGLPISDGKKHTIVLRSDGTKIQSFLDGALCEKEIPITRAIADYSLTMGRKQDATDNYASMNFYGAKVYDRALSDEELSNLPIDESLQVCLDDITSDNVIYDASGKGNNFILENAAIVEIIPRDAITFDARTERVLNRSESLNLSTNRLVIGTQTMLRLDFDTMRNPAVDVTYRGNTLRKVIKQTSLNNDTTRTLGQLKISDYDTGRKLKNNNFLHVSFEAATKRVLSSIPTTTYAYATCQEVNLGDVYDIIPAVIIDGTAQAEIRTAFEGHSYGEWSAFTPQTISCQYIQVRLRINGYCRGAVLKITIPEQEETISADIDAASTNLPFSNNYYTIPSIFPAYSENTVVIEKVTKSYCTVHIKNSQGQKVAGRVTMLVRG